MTQIDQFESMFRSSVKDIFQYQPINIKKILLITDLNKTDAKKLLEQQKIFLKALSPNDIDKIKWTLITERDFKSTQDVLDIIKQNKPHLICTYRNLHSDAWMHPHSLGEFLDVMIQKNNIPILIIPHPKADYAHEHVMKNTDNVMVLTDHLSNNHDLINYAVCFTEEKGQLRLIHIEDENAFKRTIDIISKLPDIETDNAEIQIAHQLLKEPTDYITSCISALKEHELPLKIKSTVKFGHGLKEFHKKIEKYKTDLLIMNSKDDEQLAMHGMAYPLAIELRQIPLLLL